MAGQPDAFRHLAPRQWLELDTVHAPPTGVPTALTVDALFSVEEGVIAVKNE